MEERVSILYLDSRGNMVEVEQSITDPMPEHSGIIIIQM